MVSEFERLANLTAEEIRNIRSLDYVRFLGCLYREDGREFQAAHTFLSRFPRSFSAHLFEKAAIAPGSTTDATWAGPLTALRPLAGAFLEYLRPATLLGRIPNLRRVPFNVSVPVQTAGGVYSWVGQNKPTPVTELDFSTVTVGVSKVSGIVSVTRELLEFSSPSAETVVRSDLVNGIAEFLDTQFVDPAVAAVAGVSPASITNGTVAIPSAGPTAANALTDIKALIAAFTAANRKTANLVLLMTPASAHAIGVAANSETIGADGGRYGGYPVVTSDSVGDRLIALDAQGILLADDGGLDVDVSQSATLQLDSAPADPTTATTVLVSLFQRGQVGFRCTRMITWQRARLSSVKYVSGAAYA